MDPDALSERTEQMIQRRVDQGYNEAESRTLLEELLRTRGAGTLASALYYDGFATALGAGAFAADYFEPHPDVGSASRPELAVVAATVEHSAEGTLVYGTSRDDRATIRALKDNGFRWSRRLEGWYLPRNLTHDTRDRTVAGLQAALGKRVVVEVPDGGRRLTPAEQEAARQERATGRADRMTTKAERLTVRAEAHRAAADRISENIPFGQPILLGHHSEARARRDADRIRSNMDKSIEAAAGAEAAQAAADRAERTASGSESVVTITNRIERNEALVRKVDRELAAHATAQGIIDKLGAGHPTVAKVEPERLGVRSPERLAQLEQLKSEALDEIGHDRTKLETAGGVKYGKHNVEPGDLIRTRQGGSPVIRANAKTATVPTGYSWTDTVPWSRVGKVVKAEEFSPEQVRELLAAAGEDKHRTTALTRTLARAEHAAATEAATQEPTAAAATEAASTAEPQQPNQQAGSTGAGEDQPLPEAPDVDAHARRRLSAQHGSPAALAPRTTPAPGR